MANDFSGDADCVALWKFDNNANDSKGGNNLTEVNTPTYDASDKKEGTHSIDLEEDNSQYCTVADGDLDAGFPGKSGTSEQSFSICGWFKIETLPTTIRIPIVSKWQNGTRSFLVSVETTDKVSFFIGYNNGDSYTEITFDTACAAGIWYHFGVVYDASDNSMKLRIWDDNAGALLDSNKEGTAGGDMSPDTAPVEVGRFWGTYYFDGKEDEVVVFTRVLTDSEIDQIRAGTYGAVTEKTSSDSGSGAEGTPLSGATLAGSETGSGIEALFARLLAAIDTGYGVETANVAVEGLLKELSATETAEGSDRLTAKIELPAKGGGMKLWT